MRFADPLPKKEQTAIVLSSPPAGSPRTDPECQRRAAPRRANSIEDLVLNNKQGAESDRETKIRERILGFRSEICALRRSVRHLMAQSPNANRKRLGGMKKKRDETTEGSEAEENELTFGRDADAE